MLDKMSRNDYAGDTGTGLSYPDSAAGRGGMKFNIAGALDPCLIRVQEAKEEAQRNVGCKKEDRKPALHRLLHDYTS